MATVWQVKYPDGFEPLDTGLEQIEAERGSPYYDSFREAKAELMDSIEAQIKILRRYKKELKASKKADWL